MEPPARSTSVSEIMSIHMPNRAAALELGLGSILSVGLSSTRVVARSCGLSSHMDSSGPGDSPPATRKCELFTCTPAPCVLGRKREGGRKREREGGERERKGERKKGKVSEGEREWKSEGVRRGRERREKEKGKVRGGRQRVLAQTAFTNTNNTPLWWAGNCGKLTEGHDKRVMVKHLPHGGEHTSGPVNEDARQCTLPVPHFPKRKAAGERKPSK